MCEFDPEDVIGTNCNTVGGLKLRVYYAFADDIDVPYPEPPANPADLAESVTVTTVFTMKADKKFWLLDSELESSDLVSESQGNLNNLSASNKYKFRKSGTSRQLVGWLNANQNRPIVLIVEDNEDNRRLLGQKGLFAKVESFQENSGQATADDKFIEFVVYAPGKLPYFYDAAIPLS